MKHKGLLISSAVFFILMNFNYFWERNMGVYAMAFGVVMIIMFFLLCLLLLLQLYISIKEKFSDGQRIGVMITLAGVLVLAYFKPDGLINFSKFSGKDILIAKREGSANCMTYLNLKENNSFSFQQNCFGSFETKGKYEIKGDSIFFKSITLGRGLDSFYTFAVIKPANLTTEITKQDIWLYYSSNDTLGYVLLITRNVLTK